MTRVASSPQWVSDQSPRVSRVKDRARARPSRLQVMLTAAWGRRRAPSAEGSRPRSVAPPEAGRTTGRRGHPPVTRPRPAAGASSAQVMTRHLLDATSGRGVPKGVDATAIIHAVSARVQLHGKLRENFRHVRRRPCAANGNSKETAVPGVRNGVRASQLDARWIKSRHSNAEGNCVEVAPLSGGDVAMRNSRDPDGPALVYTAAEVAAFLAGGGQGRRVRPPRPITARPVRCRRLRPGVGRPVREPSWSRHRPSAVAGEPEPNCPTSVGISPPHAVRRCQMR